MTNRARPAIVTLRMSRSLRDALHDAACAEGCSLNGYDRDERGVPLRPKARSEHLAARQAFFEAMAAEDGVAAADRLVRRHELEDPAFFVEWSRRRSA
jgi:hypothetical protein